MIVYQDEYVTLLNMQCQDYIPTMPMFDHVFTDPPYGKSTHNGALTLRKRGTTGETGSLDPRHQSGSGVRDIARKLVDFDSITYADLQAIIASVAPNVRRWFISFMERRYIEPLEQWCEQDGTLLRFVREGIYYKPNGAPQVSGDRPAQGWESIAIMHRANNGRLRWNGGGHDAVYIENKPAQAKHPTQKPLALIMKILQQYTDPGDSVLDLFAGSGVFGVGCKKLRRHCVLIERDPKHCATAIKWLRATQPMMDFDAPALPTAIVMELDV